MEIPVLDEEGDLRGIIGMEDILACPAISSGGPSFEKKFSNPLAKMISDTYCRGIINWRLA